MLARSGKIVVCTRPFKNAAGVEQRLLPVPEAVRHVYSSLMKKLGMVRSGFGSETRTLILLLVLFLFLVFGFPFVELHCVCVLR